MKNTITQDKEKIFATGRYYLIFLLMAIGGFGLLFAVPWSFVIGAIGSLIGITGIYSLIGAPIEKYTYSEPKIITLDSGEEVSCTLVRKRQHFTSLLLQISGFGIIPLERLSPFYLIPVRTQYFIACNVNRVTYEAGKFETGNFENLYEYLNCIHITKERYEELMNNPALFKDELTQRLAQQKSVFLGVVEKFEKKNLMEKESITDTRAVYQLSDELVKAINGTATDDNNLRMVFNYTGNNQYQNGFLTTSSSLDNGTSYEQQFPFEAIICDEDGSILQLLTEINNNLFSSLTISKTVNDTTDEKFVDIDKLEDLKETDTRTTLTEAIVCNVASNRKKIWIVLVCVILYYFAFVFGLAGVLALVSNPLGSLIAIPIAIALFFIAERFRKKNKGISRTASIDEIEIVKTYCKEIETKNIDGIDTTVYTLGNGVIVPDKKNSYRLKKNATCYVIYRKPENEIRWIYSSMEVKLSPELKVTDTTTE